MRCINGFLPLWCLKGGRAFLVADSPCLQLTFFPPSPLPPFPAGRGGSRLFHARGFAPCIPATEPARHWGRGKPRARRGARRFCLPDCFATVGARRGGGHNGFGRRSIFYFSCFPAPLPRRGRISPRPPFPAGRGSPKVYFAGGSAPGTPALDRLRHLQNLPSGCPAQRKAHGLLQKVKGVLFSEQCRQPRRGGTGGEELRRLRWSSPPG